MIECIKKIEIKEALKNEAENRSYGLTRDLFSEIPNLMSVGFSKTNEYDDSNYSDYFQITSINDIKVEDGRYVDDDGQEMKCLPAYTPENNYEVPFIVSVIESLADEYGYGDDHKITREEILNEHYQIKPRYNKAFYAYYNSLKTKEKVKDVSVFSKDPNWALYYAMDVLKSRLPKELEIVFKKSIKYAYYYAERVIKGKLPDDIGEYFLSKQKKILLKTFSKENDWESWADKEEKYYLAKYSQFVSKKA